MAKEIFAAVVLVLCFSVAWSSPLAQNLQNLYEYDVVDLEDLSEDREIFDADTAGPPVPGDEFNREEEMGEDRNSASIEKIDTKLGLTKSKNLDQYDMLIGKELARDHDIVSKDKAGPPVSGSEFNREEEEESADRNAIIHGVAYGKWPKKIIPFIISDKYTEDERNIIIQAMKVYHSKTCIRFKNKLDSDENYVHIFQGSGCYSHIGMRGFGEQELSLGNGCVYESIVLHELMHAAGFEHEQSRIDRDKYITVNFDNVEDKQAHNFKKYDKDSFTDLGTKYDLCSLMHYDEYAFTKESGKKTIVLKRANPCKYTVGTAESFTKIDLLKINKLYKCNGEETIEATTAITEEIFPTTAITEEIFPTTEDGTNNTDGWTGVTEEIFPTTEGWTNNTDGWTGVIKEIVPTTEGWTNNTDGWTGVTEDWTNNTDGWTGVTEDWTGVTEDWTNNTDGWTVVTEGWTNNTGGWTDTTDDGTIKTDNGTATSKPMSYSWRLIDNIF